MRKQTKSEVLYLRMAAQAKHDLFKRLVEYGDPHDVLREVLLAFAEGRVTIAPPPNRKELFNVPRN